MSEPRTAAGNAPDGVKSRKMNDADYRPCKFMTGGL